MGASPAFKVYDAKNRYIAAFHYVEHAAMLVSCLGVGSTIRDGHAKKDIVWCEGSEKFGACGAWDKVADLVEARIKDRWLGNRPPLPEFAFQTYELIRYQE